MSNDQLSTTAVKPKASSIHALPRELLIYVLRDAVTPHGQPGLRDDDRIVEPRHLANIRQVCRGFRDCSEPARLDWRLNQHVYDIRSKQSMMCLEAVANDPELAVRVTDLHFTALEFPAQFPGPIKVKDMETGEIKYVQEEEYLSEEILQDLQAVRADEKTWFPEAFPSNLSRIEQYKENISQFKEGIVEFLTGVLIKFPNLRGVSFGKRLFEKHEVRTLYSENGRYKNVIKYVYEKEPGLMSKAMKNISTQDIVCANQKRLAGLEVLLQALSKAGVALNKLEIPAVAAYADTFALLSSPNTILPICKMVETLKIQREQYTVDAWQRSISFEDRVDITAYNFPALRHLEVLNLQQWKNDHFVGNHVLAFGLTNPLPPLIALPSPIDTLNNPPPLVTLKLSGLHALTIRWVSCIAALLPTLKELTLVDCCFDLSPMLVVLLVNISKHGSLQRFELLFKCFGSADDWEWAIGSNNNWEWEIRSMIDVDKADLARHIQLLEVLVSQGLAGRELADGYRLGEGQIDSILPTSEELGVLAEEVYFALYDPSSLQKLPHQGIVQSELEGYIEGLRNPMEDGTWPSK